MRALVLYESMYGNTHAIADRCSEGLATKFDVTVLPVGQATDAALDDVDLLVCGGPTHAHGMSSGFSRKAAIEAADKDASPLVVDPAAEGMGLRDWFQTLGKQSRAAAAFDTRYDGPPSLTGRASKGIAKRLQKHGFRVVAPPESFLVGKDDRLVAGEADRAFEWGRALAASFVDGRGERVS
jgi:flavodoxin